MRAEKKDVDKHAYFKKYEKYGLNISMILHVYFGESWSHV